jgi:pimeloyl-ACP methyl ester carboxylesterase
VESRVHAIRLGVGPDAIPVGVIVPAADGAAVSVGVGEVASIHEARFAASIGEEGLWKPASSLEAGNLGLYFTEPYDPSRIPVVFVHGIGGSPQDFKKLIPALDRSRYQAWFFTYPSGFRLEKAAGALATLLELSMRKHGVPRVDIVAHSMGGLVSRAAILRLNKRSGPGRVDRFISISTPWGGYAAAKSGVKNLRYPVPSWIDMAPGSAFLTKLWKQELPARHWLIFGYDTKRLPWLTLNNDHVIDVGSALFPAAQEESVRVFGINKSHDNILFSPVTAAKMNEFLGEK